MTVDDLKKYFGTTYKFAKDTGCNSNSWSTWEKLGYIPARSQLKLENITASKLVADLSAERNAIKKSLDIAS
jgi:hypothetical protein